MKASRLLFPLFSCLRIEIYICKNRYGNLKTVVRYVIKLSRKHHGGNIKETFWLNFDYFFPGQFLHRTVIVKKTKNRKGKLMGRLRVSGNTPKPRKVMSTLGHRLYLATNKTVSCWMVQHNGGALLDGNITDYLIQRSGDQPNSVDETVNDDTEHVNENIIDKPVDIETDHEEFEDEDDLDSDDNIDTNSEYEDFGISSDNNTNTNVHKAAMDKNEYAFPEGKITTEKDSNIIDTVAVDKV